MADFSLSTLGFASLEEQALQAVLTLSERALSASWTYQPNSTNVSVLLVSLNSEEGVAFWKTRRPDYPAVCFVACSADPAGDSRWFLRMSPTLLPSRRELIELLNTLAGQIADQAPAQPSVENEPTTSASPTAAVIAEPEPQPPALPPEPGPVAEAQPDAPPPAAQNEPSDLAQEPDAAPNPQPEPAAIPRQTLAETDRFEPTQHFLGVLQQAIGVGRGALFALPGGVWLAISPKQQNYYSVLPNEGLLPLLQARAEDIRLHDLDVEKMLNSSAGKDMKAYPLQELIWQAALAASGGRLLAGCEAQAVVRLKHWPQVAHLPSYRKFIRLAAFMNHNAVRLDSIPGHTNTALADVFDFHNACEAMGLLERPGQEELVKKPTESSVKDLFRKISSRLARSTASG